MQMIQAAIDLMIEKGFDGTSISDVTQRANVAKGTLYLYFPSKEDLLWEVFLHCHHMNVTACNQGLDEVQTTIEKLCRRMKNAVRWAMEYPKEMKIDGLYLRYPKRKGYGTSYKDQMHFDTVDPIIRKGVQMGELKNLDPVLLGEVFFGIAGAYYRYVNQNPSLLEDEGTWKLCEQTVIDCLSK